jgi:hypothetical protein
MSGFVLQLRNIRSDCLSPPFPMSFPVHISRFIARFPAPPLIVPPNSHMLFLLLCSHFGTFAALTPSLSASHPFVPYEVLLQPTCLVLSAEPKTSQTENV